jgi:hypothetical protein
MSTIEDVNIVRAVPAKGVPQHLIHSLENSYEGQFLYQPAHAETNPLIPRVTTWLKNGLGSISTTPIIKSETLAAIAINLITLSALIF